MGQWIAGWQSGCRTNGSPRSHARLGLWLILLTAIAAPAHADDRPGAAAGIGPLMVAPDGDDALVELSLRNWNAYQQRLQEQKIDQAKDLAPDGFQMPRPSTARSLPFDLWSKTELEGLAGDAGPHSRLSEVGAAVAVSRDLKLSLANERREGENELQSINRAGLQANMSLQGWRLVPHASIVEESVTRRSTGGEQGTPVGSAAATTSSMRLEVAPEIRRPFKLKDGSVLEPFVNFSSRIGLDPNAPGRKTGLEQIDKFGIGLNVSQSRGYKFEATTDFEGLGEVDAQKVNGRVKLTVPLN